MSICFKFGTAGWYCVTKGNIFVVVVVLGFGWRACFVQFSKITSERVLWTRPSGLSPRGVLQVSSDGDDRMGVKIKTQKNPWTKN